MKLLVILAIAAVMLVLRLIAGRRMSMLAWAAAWWIASFALLRFGFEAPVPSSVLKIYMGIITLAIVAYVSSERARLEQVTRPLGNFMSQRRYAPALAAVAVAIPALIAFSIYRDMTSPVSAPVFGRTVHPAPPDSITVGDNEISLVNLHNPLRHYETEDPDLFREHVAKGRETYYKNCFYCHGDLMQGEGMWSHGLNPLPTDFQDPGTIAQLQEGFLFWRIAKGAPGMPSEGGPWDSAMPAWEQFLTEEEMWEVILFLYDFTGHSPRAVEEH